MEKSEDMQQLSATETDTSYSGEERNDMLMKETSLRSFPPVETKTSVTSAAATRRFFACGCLVCIIVVWIVMAEVVQGMEDAYPKPFFLRLCAHAFYALCLITWSAWRFFPLGRPKKQGVVVRMQESDTLLPGSTDNNTQREERQRDRRRRQAGEFTSKKDESTYNYLGYFNWCYFWGASIVLAWIAFISGWLWYISLPRTSVSGNSAIYQSSSTMVYLFSIVLLKERVTRLKTLSVLVSVIGVLLVSFFGTHEADSENSTLLRLLQTSQVLLPPSEASSSSPAFTQHAHPSALGYILCFASMVLYALYEVLYKKWASHSGDPKPLMNSMRFLGLVGASTIIFCSPPLLLLDLFGWETFELPRGDQAKLVALLGLLDTLFNLFLLFAIMLSSPLFASVGCLLVLPASVAWDYFAHHYELPIGALFGMGAIVIGFGGFLIEEYRSTLSSHATAPPLYDYEVLGGLHDNNSIQTVATSPSKEYLQVELPAPVPAAGISLFPSTSPQESLFSPFSDTTSTSLTPRMYGKKEVTKKERSSICSEGSKDAGADHQLLSSSSPAQECDGVDIGEGLYHMVDIAQSADHF